MPAVITPAAQPAPAGIVSQPPPEMPDLSSVFSPAGVTTTTSTTTNGSTVLPLVKFARPPIGGETLIDRGEAADFLVAHVYVGTHPQGSLVSKSDFPPGTDFDRLLNLGAVIALSKPAPAEDAAQPAGDADPDAGKKTGKGGGK